MSGLPFLQKKGWPRVATKLPETSHYGYSEDELLLEDAIKELIQAVDQKDHKMFMHALNAAIELIMNKQSGEHDADA